MKGHHPLIMWSSRPKAALCKSAKSAKSEDKRAVWSKCANFYENGSVASHHFLMIYMGFWKQILLRDYQLRIVNL